MPHADDEKRKQYQREYAKKHRERKKEYRESNKDKLKDKRRIRESSQEFKEKKNKDHKEWYLANRETILEKRRASYNEKKDKLNEGRRKQYSETASMRVTAVMSASINESLYYTETKKSGRRWEDILGYTRYELMGYLEAQFKEGMTWDNYGSYWHIDHIKPKSWFKYETENDQSFKDCWALANLQPLEAFANQSKSNRYEG